MNQHTLTKWDISPSGHQPEVAADPVTNVAQLPEVGPEDPT